MSENTQKYLGTVNAIVLCVDHADDINILGRMFHQYAKASIEIYGYNDFFLKSEEFFKKIGFPKATNSDKDFDNKVLNESVNKEMTIMGNDEILNEHGEAGTFIVRVQHRQHSSWQGRVTWIDEDKTVYFRSELELMKLIDGALNEKAFEVGEK